MRFIPLLSVLALAGTVLAGSAPTVGGPGTVALPTITVGVRKASGIEGGAGNARLAAFVLRRSGGSLDQDLSVKFTLSGSAVNGVDYALLDETVKILAGQDRVTLVVQILDDSQIEGTESAILTVVPGAGYTIGTPDHQDVTLADNDESGGHTGGGHTTGAGK